jgi:hypothetical protein
MCIRDRMRISVSIKFLDVILARMIPAVLLPEPGIPIRTIFVFSFTLMPVMFNRPALSIFDHA